MTVANEYAEISELLASGGPEALLRAAQLVRQLGEPGPSVDDFVAGTSFQVGMQLEAAGLYDHAGEIYRAIAAVETAHADNRGHAHLRLGFALHAAGNDVKATESFCTAFATVENPSWMRIAAYHAGVGLLHAGRAQEALPLFTTLRETKPVHPFEPSQLAADVLYASARVHLGQEVVDVPDMSELRDAVDVFALSTLAAALDKINDQPRATDLFRTLACCLHASDDVRAHAEKRVHVLTERTALRSGVAGSPSPEAVFEEICHRLACNEEADILEAARLCDLLPQDHVGITDPALITTGLHLEMLGRRNTAARFYRRVLALRDADAFHLTNASYRLGILLVGDGKHDEAVPLLRRVLTETDRTDMVLPAADHLACVHAMRGEFDLAREAASIAANRIAGETQEHLYWQLRDVQFRAHLGEVEHADELALSLLPTPRPDTHRLAQTWMDAAHALEVRGYTPQARVFYEALRDCAAMPPGLRTRLYYRLGIVLDRLLMFHEAQQMLQAAVECDDPEPETKAEARLRLANLRFLLDEFESVLDDFDDLRRTGSSERVRAESQLRYATCLMRLGRTAEARRELHESRSGILRGTDYEVKGDLMLAEIAENEGDVKEVAACYERVIHNPLSEPLTKAAALTRLSALKKGRR